MDDKQMEGLERHRASKNPAFEEKIPIHGISDSMSEFQHLEELKEEGLIGKGIWRYMMQVCSGLLTKWKLWMKHPGSDYNWLREQA